MSYVFNKITVRPQLPKRIAKLADVSNNMWWAWNTEFLRLFKQMDGDLWEKCEKNPTKFLKNISQDKLEEACKNQDFLKEYDKIVKDFEDYMNAKSTWFTKKYPQNQKDLIVYFSAEYGLDETVAIYSGGLGILSGDHLKSASDMGLPLVGIGLLYRNGYFHQVINGSGMQEAVYKDIDMDAMPISPVRDEKGNDIIISIKLPLNTLYLKAWKLNVGRVSLYLLDSDIDENIDEYKNITTALYGGDQEMRIKQEIVLGMGGVLLLDKLGLNPTVYHMNEGHSAFLTFQLIRNIIRDKEVSFDIARDIVSSKTVFTTHTPVPAGNDIFPISLMEKYFNKFWDKFGITKEEFMSLGMNPAKEKIDEDETKAELKDEEEGFNMGILALKIAGKKNGVSKLHGAVSRGLFAEVWPNIPEKESPIGYVTNGVHTCTWVAPTMKDLYNKYFRPYWQDDIQNDDIWQDIYKVPDEELWNVHQSRKEKLLKLVKDSTISRLRRYNYSYDEIDKIVGELDPNALTIGFARRFATYKRATLIFRDLERITKIFNERNQRVQIIFAGKAHPQDKEGQGLIKYIHELSLKPQFKGKLFILENYNIGMSRYLVSGVDVWLNNPRRPLEASGTSGQKAAVNGVLNFSVLDGWWAEGYNQKNGWAIGTEKQYQNYEDQDDDDAKSLYDTLENKIIPMYYRKSEKGYSTEWIKMMKNTIASNAGRFSTARMIADYMAQLYIPLCNLNRDNYQELGNVIKFSEWKNVIEREWQDIKIEQAPENYNNTALDAGNTIKVSCYVTLPNELINNDNIDVQVYYGRIEGNQIAGDLQIISMEKDVEKGKSSKLKCKYTADVALKSGGDYGYTFRVVPKSKMILDWANLDLIKWIEE